MQPFEEYRAIDAVNVSTLKWMAKSPRHFAHVRAEPVEDTTSMLLGRAIHASILEPRAFDEQYVVWDGDRRGKPYAEFAERNPDRVILKRPEFERCVSSRIAVRSHPVAAQLLAKGEAEKSLTWVDEETGLRCKSRLDFLAPAALIDLKTTVDVEPIAFGRTATRYMFPLQCAFYSMGLRANGIGPLPVYIIAVESGAPHDVAVYELSEDDLYLGETQARRLLKRVAECEASGQWPGQCPATMPLALPPWAFTEDGADEDDSFGLTISDTEAA